jgi:aryl-alcohol dehydrogenase
MAARLTGAARVVAVDIAPDRLALARDLGATDTVDARAEDPVAALAGRVTHAVEASGVPTVLRQAVESLAAGGTVAVVGLPPLGTEVALDVNHLLHGRTVTGVVEGDADPATFVPALLALHRAGRLPFDRLVTRYAPKDVERAAADAAAGRVVKPLLRYH